jgi:hypothetical protein
MAAPTITLPAAQLAAFNLVMVNKVSNNFFAIAFHDKY